MARARTLAAGLAAQPRRLLAHTRGVLARHLRRRLREDLDYGLAVEGLAMP